MNPELLAPLLLDWSNALLRRTLHDLTAFTRAHGLTPVQMNVLLHLYHRGECEIGRLQPVMQASKAAAGQLVERMEQQGLVERAASPLDRRARRVRLTARGRALVEESAALRRVWLDSLTAGLDEPARQRLAEVLQAMLAAAEPGRGANSSLYE